MEAEIFVQNLSGKYPYHKISRYLKSGDGDKNVFKAEASSVLCCVSAAVLACMIQSSAENIKSLTWILNCGFDRVIKQNNNSGAAVTARSQGAECKSHFYLQRRRRGHEGANIVSISITTGGSSAVSRGVQGWLQSTEGTVHFHPPTLASQHQPGRVATLVGLGWAGLGWLLQLGIFNSDHSPSPGRPQPPAEDTDSYTAPPPPAHSRTARPHK